MGRTISITAIPKANGWTCYVRIAEGDQMTSDHTVQVTTSDLRRLAPDSLVEDLVKRSFEFLLEREPQRSILPRFGLADIELYFPDYPRLIGPSGRV